jgi:hypothetical protein
VKVYHIGVKITGRFSIFVASDNSMGVNDLGEVYAQITVFLARHKTVEVLVPKIGLFKLIEA